MNASFRGEGDAFLLVGFKAGVPLCKTESQIEAGVSTIGGNTIERMEFTSDLTSIGLGCEYAFCFIQRVFLMFLKGRMGETC